MSAAADHVNAKTLESDVGPHARYSGPQDAVGERKYQERHGQQLDRYYDEVISQLGQPEAILICGPGEAKLQLQERLSRSKALAERIVGIETTDKLTDPQIVAKVREHYRIDLDDWAPVAVASVEFQRNVLCRNGSLLMAIVNALAGIMVSDLTTAAAWYEQLLSRPADARPMEGLAEWKLADGGWIQVFQDKERAGSSSVTFLVSGLDDQLAELKAKGISIERTTTSDYVKTATVTDPAGNRVVFAELTAQL